MSCRHLPLHSPFGDNVTDTTDDDRRFAEEDLRARFEANLPRMIDRHLALEKIGFGAYHHFSRALAHARDSFVNGEFTCTITVAQSVCEGLAKLAAEKLPLDTKYFADDGKVRAKERIAKLRKEGFDLACVDALDRVHDRSRNDFHHMNRCVPNDDHELEQLALACMEDLHILESWFFAVRYDEGRPGEPIPIRPEFWPRNGSDLDVFLHL
jgi:hypothetical protein